MWIRCGSGELERALALPSMLLGLETRLCQGWQEIMSMSPRDTTWFFSFKMELFAFSRNFRRVTGELAPAYIRICVPQFWCGHCPASSPHRCPWSPLMGTLPPSHLGQTCYSCAGASLTLPPLPLSSHSHWLHSQPASIPEPETIPYCHEDDGDWSITHLILYLWTNVLPLMPLWQV